MNDKNPHNICTLNDDSDCHSCMNLNQLACKPDRKVALAFMLIGFAPMIASAIGMIILGRLTGMWWILISYAIWAILMFEAVEIWALCSHCPYYAEDSKTLHCLGNNGSLKLWRYRPGPMSRFDKFIFLIVTVFVLFFLFPIGTYGYGIYFLAQNYNTYGSISLSGFSGLALLTLLSVITFIHVLRTFFCTKCINFSCPLNTVHKHIVDKYLENNPVMREAWEKSGYKLGKPGSKH